MELHLGTRVVDFSVASDKINPLVVEAPVSFPHASFLDACGV